MKLRWPFTWLNRSTIRVEARLDLPEQLARATLRNVDLETQLRELQTDLRDARSAIDGAGFRLNQSLHGKPTLWCKTCGRDSGLHFGGCGKL